MVIVVLTKLTDEQLTKLSKLSGELPKWAIKPNKDPRKSGMSVITPQYVIDVLNDIFGVGNWTVEHEVVETTEKFVVVKGWLALNTADKEKTFTTPMTYGGNDNFDLGDRYKGAVTDLMTKSAQFLGIAHAVFIGEYNGGNYSKLDEATDLAVKTFAGSKVVKQAELTDEQKSILRYYVGQWNSNSAVMEALCLKHSLPLPKTSDDAGYKAWVGNYRKLLFDLYETVKEH